MDQILIALGNVFTPMNIGMMLFSTTVGIIIGAMPGLSVNMAIVLLMPMTFSFQGMTGILMLLGVYCGAIYGGSISAILLKVPGTPASAATTLDGYPMAIHKGQPGRALGISTFASMFGGLFSALMLVIFSPLLAKVAVSFSAAEYFALAIFGISLITSVSGKSIIKGLIGGVFGLLIATVGIDAFSTTMRFTFGSKYLTGGISFVPVLIGLFAMSQALMTIEEGLKKNEMEGEVKIKRVFPTGKDMKTIFPTVLRSSIIGTFIGAVPGTGGDIASFISYNEAKRWSKRKDEFGTGLPEGVAAPEAGNNAVSGGALIPLLTLGIPGDGSTAIMLGCFMIQGISPGPLLFSEKAASVYAIFIGLFVANLIMGVLGFSSIRLFVKVIKVPPKLLTPVVMLLCVIGSFCINNSFNDIVVMVIFGIIGYILTKLDFSMSPIVIGIILGSMAESNLRRALIMSSGSIPTILTRPITAAFLIVALITLITPMVTDAMKSRKNRE